MDRRTFVNMVAAGGASYRLPCAADAQPAPKVRNVVLTHGLFADGSCWSEVITRLQEKGMHATAVQNPLTTLQAGVEATQDVLTLQQDPTVLVAHSFGGKRALFADKTTHATWRSKPRWHAVCTEDRTIHPDPRRFMAKRMGAKTIEVKASHLSLISQPHTITNRSRLDTARSPLPRF
jgi:hypothetical protein